MSQFPKYAWNNKKKTTAWKRTEGNFYLSKKCDIAHPVTWVRILIIKANKLHYFSNLFDKVLYMFRTGPLSIIRSISNTVYMQQVFVMVVQFAVCWHGQDGKKK
jgi:hypothetical protein